MNRYGQMALDHSRQHRPDAYSQIPDPASFFAEAGAAAGQAGDPGLHFQLSFDTAQDVAAPFVHSARPKVAILREQGAAAQGVHGLGLWKDERDGRRVSASCRRGRPGSRRSWRRCSADGPSP